MADDDPPAPPPHSEYLAAVRRMMDGGGFRIVETLYGGRTLVVEDLVTTEGSRSAGHGGRLLRALREHAAHEGCTQVHLDSGVQRMRAHQFYVREKLSVVGFHFVTNVPPPTP